MSQSCNCRDVSGNAGACPVHSGVGGTMENCEHPQCCICLKRECQQGYLQPRFKRYGGLLVCGDSCLSTAVSVAYAAACKLGGCQEKPCGNVGKASVPQAESQGDQKGKP